MKAGSAPTGYSGKPLVEKLGIKPGARVSVIDAPAGYRALLEPLPLGFVDIKVCAVSEIWSGLKLVVRKELR